MTDLITLIDLRTGLEDAFLARRMKRRANRQRSLKGWVTRRGR